VIKGGCIDREEDPSIVCVPKIEIFTRSRVPWIPAIEGALQEGFSKKSFVALGF
jgi:hypothetical protein